MTKLWILFKNTFINRYGLNSFSKKNKKERAKSIKKLALYLFILIYFGGLMVVYAFMGFDALSKMNAQFMMISVFSIITVFMMFFLSIFTSKTTIFNAKEDETVFSMPIKTSTIFAGKLLNMLASNYFTELIMLVPALIIYAVKMHVGIMYHVDSVLCFIFLPFIPVALSAAFGYIVASVSSKAKNKRLVETLSYFILIFVIWGISFNLQKIGKAIFKDMDKVQNVISSVFYPFQKMQEAIINSDFKALLIYIAINIAVFVVFILILNVHYKHILLKLKEVRSRGKYKEKELKSSSIDKALFFKELRTYVETPIYIFNTAFGPILLFIGAIISCIYGGNKLLNMMELSEMPTNYIFAFLLVIFAFMLTTANTAACSISLEGKSLWILKSLPINVMQIFKSKILINILVAFPLTAISSIMIAVVFKCTFVEILMIIISEIILTILVSLFGLISNLAFPKLEFKNPAQVIKQGSSELISIYSGMALILLTGVIYYFVHKYITFNIFYILVMVIYSLICVLEYRLINSWGIKKFDKLN